MPQFRTALAIALALSAAGNCQAQAAWPDERQIGPVLCHADFALAPHQSLLDELEVLQADLTAQLGARDPREAGHLFLFESRSTYQGYLAQYFPRVPYRRALYIKARGPGMVFACQGSDFEIDVRHECTHALLHAWLPSVPLWLDEGLAEYFEVARDERSGKNPHHAVLKTMIRTGQLPRLEKLEAIEELSDMGRDEYRDAWAWVHFALHGPPEAREELLRYLADLEGGGEPGPLSHRLRLRLPNLDQQMAEHFK